MSTPVVMPQMGESIAEGTIVRWIKKVGDTVDRDEPLFEISTDKVDAEIPSPAAGTLIEIAVKEGETVAVNSVVGTIGEAGESAVGSAAEEGAARETAPDPVESPAPPGRTAPRTPQADGSPLPPSAPNPSMAPSPAESRVPAEATPEPEEGRQRTSPLVRRIAKEHGVDLRLITGTGIGGRVTKQDILGYLAAPPAPPAPAAPAHRTAPVAPVAPDAPVAPEVVPMSVMRQKIAEHMTLSRRTSAHVYSVFEVDYTKVDQLRKAHRDEYERRGVKLTYTSFIAKTVIDCLRRHRIVNASIDGDKIVYHPSINLGIAVALEHGLIVPVVKNADEINLLGLSRAIADVADRARAKKLNPEEVHGGTFTITNPGNYGAQFGLPIINQPQVAILGVGTIEKRVVAIEDMIAVRLRGYLTLGYDHRLIDGAVADQFMADVKKGLETFEPNQV